MRDVAMIDAFPVHEVELVVLDVGCGQGRLVKHLSGIGYTAYGVDANSHKDWGNYPNFHKGDIFDVNTMPISSAPIVVCSETLEHLVEYPRALDTLIELATVRIIITVPFERSYDSRKVPPPEGHVNYWNDEGTHGFKNIYEFVDMCNPYSVAISKIRSKLEDVRMRQRSYLITVDKRQGLHG